MRIWLKIGVLETFWRQMFLISWHVNYFQETIFLHSTITKHSHWLIRGGVEIHFQILFSIAYCMLLLNQMNNSGPCIPRLKTNIAKARYASLKHQRTRKVFKIWAKLDKLLCKFNFKFVSHTYWAYHGRAREWCLMALLFYVLPIHCWK